MNLDQLYRGQYLISRSEVADLKWNRLVLGDHNIYHHSELSCTSSNGKLELVLLGELYSWKYPSLNNQDLLDKLSSCDNLNELLIAIDELGGQFLLIVREGNDLIVVPDACAQMECYYSVSGQYAGRQTNIFNRIAQNQRDEYAKKTAYYASEVFRKKSLHILDETHLACVRKLLPNHYLYLNSGKIVKRWPQPRVQTETSEVASKAAPYFKGFLKAMKERHELIMGVTAGYDSRVLFLASLGLEMNYYVSRHSWMADDHYDLVIPEKLCEQHGKRLEVIPDKKLEDEKSPEYLASVDFPRASTGRCGAHHDKVFVNGNVSEVARNYFGSFKNISGADLAYLNGYVEDSYVLKKYENWLEENRSMLNSLGYHELDFFYWEEKMGNWGVKAKTEWAALGDQLISPFNCRDLLLLLLSSPRKDRDAYLNKLYNAIFKELGQKAPALPINPGKKESIIRIMKRIKVFDLYRKVGLKLRILRV